MVVRTLFTFLITSFLFNVSIDVTAQSFDPLRFYKSPASITYGLNNRRTALLGNGATLFGAYIGVQWGDRLKHVVTANSSVFWISSREAARSSQTYHLNYLGVAEEYILIRWKRFNVVSFLHGGWGAFHTRTLAMPDYTYSVAWVLPLEVGGHLSFAATEWARLIGGAGYRWVVFDETNGLDGLYYKISVSIDIRSLRQTYKARRSNDIGVKHQGSTTTIDAALAASFRN